MKYLFINGSPHKGNTWRLSELVLSNLQRIDKNAIFNEIHLSELNLPFCCGCSNCFRIGIETCPHFDKVSNIINAIDEADGVVFVSTTFNMRETALLKNLFDHLCFMFHRPHFFKSKAMILTTAGGIGAKSAAKSIASTLKGIGFNRCYLFSSASFSWNDYMPKEKTKLLLGKITSRFYYDILSGKLHCPSCILLIPYNLFRGMSPAYVKGTKFETLDGVYWTEDNRKKYVYDSSVKVSFYKKPIGHIFYAIGKLASKFTMVTYRK